MPDHSIAIARDLTSASQLSQAYFIQGPDRLTIDLAGIKYPFLAETPVRLAAEPMRDALSELLTWVEDYHDMKGDPNVPDLVRRAREALAAATTRGKPKATERAERDLAPFMVTLLRRVAVSHGLSGEVPDPVVEDIIDLLAQIPQQ